MPERVGCNKVNIFHLHQLLEEKQISSVELAQCCLDAIEQEKELGAYVTVTAQIALEAAKRADERRASGKALGMLDGIPVCIKDNILIKGVPSTCCSNILREYVPPYSATVWSLLEQQGAVLLGKCNMDEFAMGSSCTTSCFGPSRNPHNRSCVPGGSSGGSAVAVAGNLAACSLGSDTGGSVRQPAAFCGCVGLKPTYGALSRRGLVAYASSLDTVGIIASSAQDCACVYDVLSRHDEYDSTSLAEERVSCASFEAPRTVRIGIAAQLFESAKEQCAKAANDAAKVFCSLGAELVDITLPLARYALETYCIIACAEASSNLGRYDGMRYGSRAAEYGTVQEMMQHTRSQGFGEQVRRRILTGTYVLSTSGQADYYEKANRLRAAMRQMLGEVFERCDVILCPTTPTPAFTIEEAFDSNFVESYSADRFTVLANLCAVPAVSFPGGYDGELPLGVQLIGAHMSEPLLLSLVKSFEEQTAFAYAKTADCGVKL